MRRFAFLVPLLAACDGAPTPEQLRQQVAVDEFRVRLKEQLAWHPPANVVPARDSDLPEWPKIVDRWVGDQARRLFVQNLDQSQAVDGRTWLQWRDEVKRLHHERFRALVPAAFIARLEQSQLSASAIEAALTAWDPKLRPAWKAGLEAAEKAAAESILVAADGADDDPGIREAVARALRGGSRKVYATAPAFAPAAGRIRVVCAIRSRSTSYTVSGITVGLTTSIEVRVKAGAGTTWPDEKMLQLDLGPAPESVTIERQGGGVSVPEEMRRRADAIARIEAWIKTLPALDVR